MPYTPLPKALLKAGLNYRGQRRLLVREQFFRLARHFTPLVVAEQDGLKFLVRTDDEGVGRLTFADMALERGTLDSAVEWLGKAGVPIPSLEAGTFLDIGANIGTTSVTAVAGGRFARAICVEALPANCDLLERNAELNGVASRVDCIRTAVSDRVGTVRFEQAQDNWGDGRVRVEGEELDNAYGEHARPVVDLPATTIDALVESGRIDMGEIVLAWIDAQGHEAQILAAAGSLLGSEIPIVVEFWPYGLEQSGGLQRFLDLLTATNRRFVDLAPSAASGHWPVPIAELPALVGAYPGTAFTDLLLLT